jgi:hypothetical protein
MAPVHLADGSWRCLSVILEVTEGKQQETRRHS